MVDKNFPFVVIPDDLRQSLGKQDPGTRVFRAYGSEEDCKKWFESVLKICRGEGSVSPGGVSMYAGVSRPAVHKRLKEGRLTGFFFYLLEGGKLFKDRKKISEGGRPYIYIPVSESKAWAEELKRRPSRMETQDEEVSRDDVKGTIMKAPRGWRKRLKRT
ncbi:MAG TPA: hypothetical protein VN328_11950 [Thermodesulfovibrionales bacterium]|nr:hypothetical protein [Thermodesulfovibrionales bacterium]